MTAPDGRSPSRRRALRAPGRSRRIFFSIAAAVVVLVAGLGVYTLATDQPATLVIYTYASLFGGSDCGAPAWSTVFGSFEQAHHVTIDVECPAGTLVNTLSSQKNAPGADLVIGLDEITGPLAEANGLLIPYSPPALANVAPELVAQLSPDRGVVPYEWGYLGIDYSSAFAAATGGAVSHLSLADFASNASWARQLQIEDPSQDITGEEFLAWQVLYYEDVLHQNWTSFWRATLPYLPPPAPDWGTAFDSFSSPGGPAMVVSYTTDPAYAAANGTAGQYNSTASWSNGTAYGWRTIYGIGIVNGTRHLSLDQQFENWFLSGPVQALIPENEWEYPANQTIALPSVFAAAPNPATIQPLNNLTTPAALAAELPGWISTWLGLATGAG